MNEGNETFVAYSNILYIFSDCSMKYQLKGVNSPFSLVYNSPDTNLFIISHITCKLFKVFSDKIIELIKASVPGFLKIGINNLPKKNLARKIFFLIGLYLGIFVQSLKKLFYKRFLLNKATH